jgi:hypothetical protein
MSWVWPRHLALLVSVAALLMAARAGAQVLLRDDFDTPPLDGSKWMVPTEPESLLGRIRFRPPSVPLSITDGSIRLQLDTHDPSASVPGSSFLGSEIRSIDTYSLENGLVIEARARLVSPLPGGLVGSLLTFGPLGEQRGEIDFELSSNDLNATEPRVVTQVFDHSRNSNRTPDARQLSSVAGLSLDAFHVYRIEWFPSRVTWLIDGEFVREETETVPKVPQSLRLHFFAPNASFREGHNGTLTPAATPEENEIYFFEVDWVKIRRPVPLWTRLRPWIGVGLVGLAGLIAATAIVRRMRA